MPAPVRHLLRALLCAIACVASVAPASAMAATADMTITADRLYPQVDETITFTVSPYDCSMYFTFTVDGVARPVQTEHTFTASFSTPGPHTVTGFATRVDPGQGCGDDTGTTTVDILPKLTGSMLVTPESPAPGAAVDLEATQTGGKPGYTYAWDSDNDGQFDDETSRIITKVFPTVGGKTVRVRITDNATPAHQSIVSRAIQVATPTPTPTPTPLPPGATPAPATPTPAPTPAPCQKQLAFQLSEFTTTGCFTRTRTSPSEQWTTRASVTLNGIPFKDYGQTFTITFPTPSEPGGHFTAPNSSVEMQATTFFSGDIDWALPAGKQGDEKNLRTFNVFVGARVFGLNVRGSIALKLGWDAKGMRYATFPLNIELPVGFNSGPYESAGRVTGAASLRTDALGPHFDGLKIAVTNVWLGKLKVLEACLSYVPGGGQAVAPCDPPDAGGVPYLQCESNVNANRWDGNAVIELPSSRGVQFGLFGGLADGKVSKLGGFVDNLGNRVPIASGVYLNKIGLGLCLDPPPLKIKGEIGVAILPLPNKPPLIGIDGSFTYTDSDGLTGWTMEIGGRVTLYDTTLGRAAVKFGPNIPWDFDVNAAFNLYDLASLDGRIVGWVDPPSGRFNVSGFVRGCLAGELCAEARGLVSSTGAAGCITAGSMDDTYLVILDHSPYLKFVTRTTTFSIGFGYTWNTGALDLLGSSCNFSPYTAVKPTAARARRAADGVIQTIKPDTTAISLRYHGTNGPPKLALTGPDGSTITSPTSGHTAQVEGKYTLVEDSKNGTTNLVLINPAAGDWTAKAVPGAASSPTTVEQSVLEAPPTLGARVRTSGRQRVVELTYAVPAGSSVQLVELGKGITRVVASSVKGGSCAYGPRRRPGTEQLVRCAQVRFTPSPGPGGKRVIGAVVSRDGVPIARQDVGTFTAPKLVLPSRPGTLRVRRAKGGLSLTFPRVAGASTVNVSAVLSDGRSLAFEVKAKCAGIRIPAVPKGVSAKLTVIGVRYDLAVGKRRTLTIRAKKQAAGPKATGRAPRGAICTAR
jgi:hypothetical protein